MDCGSAPFTGVDVAKVNALSDNVPVNPHYRKPIKPLPNRKKRQAVPLVDCFDAGCRTGCPIHQDIPAYLMRAGEGKYAEALEIYPPPQRPALHPPAPSAPTTAGTSACATTTRAPWTSGA